MPHVDILKRKNIWNKKQYHEKIKAYQVLLKYTTIFKLSCDKFSA